MRRTLIAAAAAALSVAATGFACAQERQQGQEQPGAAHQSMESGKGAMGQGAAAKDQMRQAQAQSGMEQKKEEERPGAAESGKQRAAAQAEQKGAEQKGAEQQGQAQKANPAEEKKAAQSEGERNMQNNREPGKAENATGKANEQRTGETEKGNRVEERQGQAANTENKPGENQKGLTGERQNNQGEAAKNEQTGKNEGGEARAQGNAHLTGDRAAKIEHTLMASARPQHLNINVNVGAALPGDVTLEPLPPDVVSLVPEYRGYDFVVVNDEIVIVQPSTRHVVEILGGGGETQAMATTHVGPCGQP